MVNSPVWTSIWFRRFRPQKRTSESEEFVNESHGHHQLDAIVGRMEKVLLSAEINFGCHN